MFRTVDKSLESNLFPSHQNLGYQPLQYVSVLSSWLKLRHLTVHSVCCSTTLAMIAQLLIILIKPLHISFLIEDCPHGPRGMVILL